MISDGNTRRGFRSENSRLQIARSWQHDKLDGRKPSGVQILTDERTNIQACSRQTSKPELGLKSRQEKAGLSENPKPETKTEIQLMLTKTKLKIGQNLSTGYRSSKKPKS
jgi:hypothetical protein